MKTLLMFGCLVCCLGLVFVQPVVSQENGKEVTWGRIKAMYGEGVLKNGPSESGQILPGEPPLPIDPSIVELPSPEEIEGKEGPRPAGYMCINPSVIVSRAYAWLGVPYRYGGTDRSGIDCSWLVYRVYRESGMWWYPFMSTWSMRNSSQFICVAVPRSGDLVLFRNLGHVGIYIGNGFFIDANSYHGRVVVDYLYDSYWQSQGPYIARFIG